MADVTTGTFGGTPFREFADLFEGIWTAIMEYEGRVPTVAVVGVLRMVEHRLLTEVHIGTD